MSGRILVVDDEQSMCEALAAGLAPRGFSVRWETSAEAGLALLETVEVDVVLSDLNMRGMDGFALCERVVANRPDLPVVVITAFGSLETAIAAIRAGAYDFITKPVKMDALAVALARAVQHRSLGEEVKRLRRLVGETQRFEELIGDSPAMRKLHQLLDRVADSDASVLITGESGTGKEVVAKALHRRGNRKDGPVGGSEEVPFDVRLVATTNRDLESAVEEGLFREDLYFRINVIPVETPPLRARGNDVLLLAQHFLVHFAEKARKSVTGLSPPAAERLLAYAWPGNVRELQNSMERAVALTQYEQITVDDLPEKIRAYRPSHVLIAADDPSELVPLEEMERRYILRVMEAVGGNRTLAAKVLRIGRKTLYRKLALGGAATGHE